MARFQPQIYSEHPFKLTSHTIRQICCFVLLAGVTSTLLEAEPNAIIVEGMPPTYRKVGLSGRPFCGPMPQNFSDSDSEPEETFVDALTLRLQSRTSDIYNPMGAGDFALTVNRNIMGSCWKAGEGVTPADRPDLPFGNCWTTGLAANVCLIERENKSPLEAIVTDEEGTIHRFVSPSAAGMEIFVPIPTSQSQQDFSSLRLQRSEQGIFTLTRKFGTQLTFAAAPNVVTDFRERAKGERYSYYRLQRAKDKLGFAMTYEFDELNRGLIPDRVYCAGLTIRIFRNKDGLIDRIVDPAGASRLYRYRKPAQSGGKPLLIEMSKQITGKERDVVTYEYDETTTSQKTGHDIHYCDIAVITSKKDNTYRFTYSKTVDDKTKPTTRKIRSAKLPGDFGTTTFAHLKNTGGNPGSSSQKTFVKDAVGNGIFYEFFGNDFKTVRFRGQPLAQLNIHESQAITYLDGSSWKKGDAPKQIDSLSPSKVLGTEKFSFRVDAGGALAKAQDMHGNVWSFKYDDTIPKTRFTGETEHPVALVSSDPTSWTTPTKNTTTQQYSQKFRLPIERIDPLGRITVWERSENLETLLSQKLFADEKARSKSIAFQHTDYSFDDPKRPGIATKKSIRKTGTTPEKLDWEVDLIESYEINEMGNVSKTVYGSEDAPYEVILHYDKNGNLRSRIYQNGYRIDFKYDSVNHLTTVFDTSSGPDRIVSRRIYGPRGLETFRKEDGTVERYEYDQMSRKIKIARISDYDDPKSKTTIEQSIFNAAGSAIEGVDENGFSYTANYDALQRCTHIRYSDSTSYTYSYGKNSGSNLFASSNFQATKIDYSEDRFTTVHTFDGIGNKLSTSKQRKGNQSEFDTEIYEHDAAGNHISIINASSEKTQMYYDPLNRNIRTVFPNGKSSQTLYTSTGLKYAVIRKSGAREDTVYDSYGDPVE